MRTFAKYLLAVVGGVLAFVALISTATWLLVGTPSHIASTAMSVVQSTDASSAVGDMLVEQLLSGADEQSAAALEPKRPQLAAAAGAALGQQGEAISGLVTTVIDVTRTGEPARVDIAPILGSVLTAMHAVDAQVPTQVDGDMAIDLNPAEMPPIADLMSGLGGWWVLVVLAIAALLGAGLCDRRRGFRRFRVSGITLGIAALIVLGTNVGGAIVGGGISMDDARASALVSSVIGVVRNTMITVSVVALLVAVLIIVLSIVIRPKSSAPDPVESAAP